MFSDSENMTRYARRPGEYEAVFEELGVRSDGSAILETVVRIFGFKEYYVRHKRPDVILNWRFYSKYDAYGSYNLYTDNVCESAFTDTVSFYFAYSKNHEFAVADKSRMKSVRVEIVNPEEIILSING